MTNSIFPGVSNAAEYLSRTEQAVNNHQRQAITFSRQPALDAVLNAWLPCEIANWDGEGAIPITENTYLITCRLIESLPLAFPSPAVVAEPDGHLNLEWYKNPRRLLSVSVSPQETLHWAAIIGTEDPRGSCRFLGEIPATLLYWIGRVNRG